MGSKYLLTFIFGDLLFWLGLAAQKNLKRNIVFNWISLTIQSNF